MVWCFPGVCLVAWSVSCWLQMVSDSGDSFEGVFAFSCFINLFKTKQEQKILGIVFVLVTMVALTAFYLRAIQFEWGTRAAPVVMGLYISTNTVSYLAALAFIIYSY